MLMLREKERVADFDQRQPAEAITAPYKGWLQTLKRG